MLFDSLVKQGFEDINQITVYRDTSDNRLKLKRNDINEVYPIKPIRYFPYTGDEYYIGLFLVEPDGRTQKELVLISDLKRLDENTRKLIEEELNKIQPILNIKKILLVKDVGKFTRWQVYTKEEGELTFELMSERDVNQISSSLVVVKDSKNTNYKINLLKLDEKSQSQLEIYL